MSPARPDHPPTAIDVYLQIRKLVKGEDEGSDVLLPEQVVKRVRAMIASYGRCSETCDHSPQCREPYKGAQEQPELPELNVLVARCTGCPFRGHLGPGMPCCNMDHPADEIPRVLTLEDRAGDRPEWCPLDKERAVVVRAATIHVFPETEEEVATAEKLIEKEGVELPESLRHPPRLPSAECECKGWGYELKMGEPDPNGHHPNCDKYNMKCGSPCDKGSPCKLQTGHLPAERHETEHGCIFYDD